MPAAEVANAACRLSAAAPRPAVLTRGAEPPGNPTTLCCRRRSASGPSGPPQPWVADGGQIPGPGTPRGWLSRRARLSRHGLLLVRDEPPRAPHPVAGPAARVLQGPDRAGLLDPAARAVPGAVRR